MLSRKLGRSDLDVSVLCFGGNIFGWTTDEQASYAVLDAFMDAGGNFIDSADVYSRWVPGNQGGESEEVLGRWMKARGNRSSVIVATKLGSPMGDDSTKQGLSRRWMMQAVEDSLGRLQTDYIDLYQSHRDDPTTPMAETLGAYDELIKQGKVRYIGASNFTAERLAEALATSKREGLPRYESLQPVYNLVQRADYEQDLEPLCQKEEVGVIPYSSLASGFLAGKYKAGEPLPSSPRASGIQQRYMNDKGFAVLEAVESVATRLSATPAQVSLAWIAARPGMTGPIASATTPEQLRDLIGGIDLKLDINALATLDKASAWKNGA
jgi:aryl-alcohol dehydrogenase-like predicted oxidoreductase